MMQIKKKPPVTGLSMIGSLHCRSSSVVPPVECGLKAADRGR
ncbi:hypothetical protein AALB39_24460 [Lachnospiraceae bacterium 54-53]